MSGGRGCINCEHASAPTYALCSVCAGAFGYPYWEPVDDAPETDCSCIERDGACAGNVLRDADIDSKIAYGSKKSAPFLRALTEVWRVNMFGEKKHGANNWQSAKSDGMHYYEDALWRHWIERRMGEVRADDSGCYHLAHMAWNALMLLEMELRGVTNSEWESAKLETAADTEDDES